MGRDKDLLRDSLADLEQLERLLHAWDPRAARGEHAREAARLLLLFVRGGGAPEAAEELRRYAGERLGIPSTADDHLATAEALVAWWRGR